MCRRHVEIKSDAGLGISRLSLLLDCPEQIDWLSAQRVAVVPVSYKGLGTAGPLPRLGLLLDPVHLRLKKDTNERGTGYQNACEIFLAYEDDEQPYDEPSEANQPTK